MKKTIVVFLVVLIGTMNFSFAINTDDQEETQLGKDEFNAVLEGELDKLELEDLEEIYENHGAKELFQGKSLLNLVEDFAKGEGDISLSTVFDYLITSALTGISKNIGDIIVILVVVLLSAIIINMMSDALGNVNEVALFSCYLVVVTLIFKVFMDYVVSATEIIDISSNAARIIFPPLLTLMTALGGVSSAAVFRPAIAMLCTGMVEFVKGGILPIAVLGGTTSMLSGLSSHIHLKKFSCVCSSLTKWLLGIISTVYIGILSIQGMMSSTFDGIYLKTAKYTVDSAIPFVGGMMSDTVDVFMGCSLLIKNAIGFSGLLILVSIIVTPLISMIVSIFLYKILAALLESVADEKIILALDGVAKGLTTLFVVVLVVVAMIFITVTLALSAGNTNIMLR